jgi:hypothetical protein
MSISEFSQDRTGILTAAGLPIETVAAWNEALPERIVAFPSDQHAYSEFWLKSAWLINQLPVAARRNEREHAAAA